MIFWGKKDISGYSNAFSFSSTGMKLFIKYFDDWNGYLNYLTLVIEVKRLIANRTSN